MIDLENSANYNTRPTTLAYRKKIDEALIKVLMKMKAPASQHKVRVPRLDLQKLSPTGSPDDNKNYNLNN